jgi:catechol 2,3-dioxygenase-like lactoylglutathione lyase family enzyme
MSQGIEVVGLYVRDQDEALAFYVEKLGFRDPSGNGWKMIESGR